VETVAPVKCVGLFPEPTPYRAPLFDRLASLPDLDLSIVYTAQTVAGRTWDVELHHPAVFLHGFVVPGMRRLLRHDYLITRGVGRLLDARSPDIVVVSGWSTYASQAAMAWCRRRGVPYVVVVESHDRDPRARWRRAVKWTVMPRLLGRAAGALVTGTLARESMVRAGVPPERIWLFANTVDTHAFAAAAAALGPRRRELRAELGIPEHAVVALSVCRLVREKGLEVFLRAAAVAEQVHPVLAGNGPEREALQACAAGLGIEATFLGDVEWERVVELYAAADLFVLVSRHEPWGVVVNEAAACGLPLLLSEHVGAAADLLEPGANGFLVPVDDVTATAGALRRLASDAALRARQGRRSREIAEAWGYEASVAGFRTALTYVLSHPS
jgi:glycosyltransferase involved in cell wall biosynthesis